MKKLIHSVAFSSLFVSALIGGTATVPLKQGWNAVGTNSEMTLEELKVQLGSQLLNIQNPDGSKKYSSISTKPATFSQFDIGVGYWIKVSTDTSIVVVEKDLSGEQTVSLKFGWNLIDPLNTLTLDGIKSQLGPKLLNIQNPDGSKKYSSISTKPATFSQFEDNIGYWVKLNTAGTLKFTFASLVTNQAVDGMLNPTIGTYSNYTLKVLTDMVDTPTLSSNINIDIQINNVNIGTTLAISASYDTGTKFKVVVFNSANEIVGSSNEFTLTDAIKSATDYDIGNITVIDSNGTIDTPPNPDTNTTINPPQVPF